jgi:hypothetical protein
MIAKSFIAAVAVAGSALAFSAPEASAKTNWDIQLGIGIPAFPVYEAPVYIERPVHVYRPYYSRRYYEEPRYRYVDEGISCGTGKEILRDSGFRGVDAYDCSAPTFGYTAWKRGGYYRVRVNYVGDIVSARRID